ncbi:MAG: hypothetical protein CVU90_15185 [Firmicutes bacterium HGW-Firmicutes-15]|jgi:hypothetical protein|nr:MAG: hypothetical protein CVU90_15185 [Firmicutes bacterium HGW-Firmicutes-15]
MFNQPVYNDGVCEIYRLDENDERVVKHTGIRFQKRILGFKRFYAAQAAQTDIARVIRIPHIIGIDAHDYVEITGEGIYEVIQSQDILDFTPNPIDLTLRQLEMHT